MFSPEATEAKMRVESDRPGVNAYDWVGAVAPHGYCYDPTYGWSAGPGPANLIFDVRIGVFRGRLWLAVREGARKKTGAPLDMVPRLYRPLTAGEEARLRTMVEAHYRNYPQSSGYLVGGVRQHFGMAAT